jgi:hypothetical protein
MQSEGMVTQLEVLESKKLLELEPKVLVFGALGLLFGCNVMKKGCKTD